MKRGALKLGEVPAKAIFLRGGYLISREYLLGPKSTRAFSRSREGRAWRGKKVREKEDAALPLV